MSSTRRRTSLILVLAAAGALSALAVPAAAHETRPFEARVDRALAGSPPGRFVHIEPLGPTRRGRDGLLEVRLPDGQIVETHGVDPPPRTAAQSTAFGGPDAPQRGLQCSGLPRLRVLYVHPSDRRSRWSNAMYDRIRTYMRQMSYRLNADALASSGGRIGADYRVRCNSSAKLDIQPLRSTTTASEDEFAVIRDDLRRAGYDSPQGKYLIWYDDPAELSCGVGQLWNDDRKSTSNRSNGGPLYGVVHGNLSGRTCWGAYVGMHENGHTMGAVQYDAPRSSGDRGHCNDGLDVMCYADGGDKSAYSSRRCSAAVFDCGRDTYFDTLTEPGEWLRSRWNLGWTGNRYLDFRRAGEPGLTPSG